MRNLRRSLGITVLALVMLVGGLSASWFYTVGLADGTQAKLPIISFPWEGAEELPHEAGENHKQLIDTIINGVSSDGTNIGLNNPNSYLAEEIDNRSSSWLFSSDTLGSMDYWENEDINKYFDLDTSGLAFLMYFPNGEGKTYYLYTMTNNLGGQNSPNTPVGEYIYPVYRTTLTKNSEGKYEAVKTEEGYAESGYYSNPITGSIFVKYPSIDPDSWRAGARGESKDNAIYTFIGETQTAYLTQSINEKYYKIATVSANTVLRVSIDSQNSRSSIFIYSGNNLREVSLQAGTQGGQDLTFVAQRNTTYYIVLRGDAYTSFTLKQN